MKPAGILARLRELLAVELLEQAALDADDARAGIEHEDVERRRAARGLGLADLVHGEQRRQFEVDVVLLLQQRHDDGAIGVFPGAGIGRGDDAALGDGRRRAGATRRRARHAPASRVLRLKGCLIMGSLRC